MSYLPTFFFSLPISLKFFLVTPNYIYLDLKNWKKLFSFTNLLLYKKLQIRENHSVWERADQGLEEPLGPSQTNLQTRQHAEEKIVHSFLENISCVEIRLLGHVSQQRMDNCITSVMVSDREPWVKIYVYIIFLKENNGNNCCNNGDRVPAIWSHPAVGLHTVGSVNGRLQRFNYKGIKLGKKFNLVIEQVWINGEVCFTWYSLHFLYVPQQKNFTSNLQPPCYFWNLVLTRTPPPVFDQFRLL